MPEIQNSIPKPYNTYSSFIFTETSVQSGYHWFWHIIHIDYYSMFYIIALYKQGKLMALVLRGILRQ